MKVGEIFPGLMPHVSDKETYSMINGNAEDTQYDPDYLVFGQFSAEGPLPGVRYVGEYVETGSQGEPVNLPVVSFLYHKIGPDGQLETQERVVIWRGVGYGTHPGHSGQEPTYYLSGSQIGAIDHATGRFSRLETEAQVIASKQFSIDCITDGPNETIVLANPA
ncbi:hypothetical protein KDA23_02000 [Candidatus Saccharibacteria bacterium]|nr:hypothetical protein [Candidatus Saccharibacteria bacterium]